MRIGLSLLCVVLFITNVYAEESPRYLEEGKVLYETPVESDVLQINTAFGFSTILEFGEKPILVTTGDNTLIQIEVPKNSKNVIIKPLDDMGETNLFVFTQNQRFNYKVVIGEKSKVDYVIDVKEVQKRMQKIKDSKDMSVEQVLQMARNYSTISKLGNFDRKSFTQKRLYKGCTHPRVDVSLIEVFSYKLHPHYLVLHIPIRNSYHKAVTLNERNSRVFVNGKEFLPNYVLFEEHDIAPEEKVHGWLVLQDSFMSMDNDFKFALGVNNETYICR